MNYHRSVVPFTTASGLQIGCAYTPKPRPPVGDALTLQRALLEPLTTRRPSVLARLLAPLWRTVR